MTKPSVLLLLCLAACAHKPAEVQKPAPAASAALPTEEEVGALYQKKDWPRLDAACRRVFAAQPGPDVASCVAMSEAHLEHRDEALAWLEKAEKAGMQTPPSLEDPDFAPLKDDPRFLAFVTHIADAQRKRNAANGVGSGIPESTPEKEGIDPAALQRLVDAAKAAHSSALVILRHGRRVGEWDFGNISARTETMSATKGVSSLAVGVLLQNKQIDSIDAPMTTWFPEWKDGIHDGITLRQILTHTSNLDAPRTAEGVYASGDAVHYALGLKMAGPPGGAFFYNNAAVNLIPALVKRVTGEPMDLYLSEKLFGPLGIRDFAWQKDPKGTPLGMSGLRIHAADFAKLGQLVLQHGVWNGRRLLPEDYLSALARPAQSFTPTSSLLWWVGYPEVATVLDDAFFAAARAKGMKPEVLAKLETLHGKEIPRAEMFATLGKVLGPNATQLWVNEVMHRKLQGKTVVHGKPDELSARGSFDQLLLVFPAQDLVVVRFTRDFDEANPDESSFGKLDDLARKLMPNREHGPGGTGTQATP